MPKIINPDIPIENSPFMPDDLPISMTYLTLYLSLIRELIDELNREGAAGLITHRALPLISMVDRHTHSLERIITNAESGRSS